MTHGALFNGIGGFQLAASWLGWENVFSVEIDKWCNKVTKQHFPNCEQHEDIYKFDGTKYAGRIDVISGGFPCQPFSVAGKRRGKEDDRYIWPEMLRVISEIRPAWVLGENVGGIVGVVLDEVLSDLENIGYEAQPILIPACAIGAPHIRERVWVVAHSMCGRLQTVARNNFQNPPIRAKASNDFNTFDAIPRYVRKYDNTKLRTDDGLPRPLDRAKRLKAIGNAIVPQVAYEIFKAIAETTKTVQQQHRI